MSGFRTVLSRFAQFKYKFTSLVCHSSSFQSATVYRLLIALALCHASFLSAANKETVVIVSHGVRMKCDFASLFSPDERSLIFLTSPDCRKKLRADQEKYFAAILESNDFSSSGIIDGCLQALKITATTDPKRLRILTVDEDIMLPVGEARERLGTYGPYCSDLEPFRNKLIMKKKIEKNNIPIPKHIPFQKDKFKINPTKYVEKIAAQLSFPIFAKPIDGEISGDTCKINNLQELDAWCKAHINADNYELDEFISGELYHCDSIIQNGKAIFFGCCRYGAPSAEFMNGKPLSSYTLNSSDPDYSLLASMNERVLSALSPVPDGMTHLEVFKDASGKMIFLEIACRPPGAAHPEVYEKAFDINLHLAHFKAQMGLSYTLPAQINPPVYAAFLWFPRKQGIVSSCNDPWVESPFTFNCLVQKGDILDPPTNILDRIGVCLLWNTDYEALLKDFYSLFHDFQPVTYLEE